MAEGAKARAAGGGGGEGGGGEGGGAQSFDAALHIHPGPVTEQQQESINALRATLLDIESYAQNEAFCTDACLRRFLQARNYDLKASRNMLLDALSWRDHRQPQLVQAREMENECSTGKIYCPGHDKWGRPVLVFDNSVQNTDDIDHQMRFLGFSLEFSIREMPANVEKYQVFINLGAFSLVDAPPIRATKETIQMLCYCYPERLGHCVLYKPPVIFKWFFNTVKHFIDQRTASKIVFVTGDVSDGSDNDMLMREIIGDNWKVLTGAEQPIYREGCSPGYDHERYWPTVIARERAQYERMGWKPPTESDIADLDAQTADGAHGRASANAAGSQADASRDAGGAGVASASMPADNSANGVTAIGGSKGGARRKVRKKHPGGSGSGGGGIRAWLMTYRLFGVLTCLLAMAAVFKLQWIDREAGSDQWVVDIFNYLGIPIAEHADNAGMVHPGHGQIVLHTICLILLFLSCIIFSLWQLTIRRDGWRLASQGVFLMISPRNRLMLTSTLAQGTNCMTTSDVSIAGQLIGSSEFHR